MKGQWYGKYAGDVSGDLMINIDESEEGFEGVAYIQPSQNNLPASAAFFSTNTKDSNQTVTAYFNAVDPRTSFQCKWDDIKHLYNENVVHSNESSIRLELKEEILKLSADTDVGLHLTATLDKPAISEDSKITGTDMSWIEFKNYISEISKSKSLFRGQMKPWRLVTSFHRNGRYRISQFTSHDVRVLHQRLSSITDHYFDLHIPEQNGAFLNLLQHHGYPTPLLDWSYSPYVSAFFAFRDWPMNYSGNEKVRLYIFDNKEWQRKYPQIQHLDPPYPHLSVMEFISIDNPRSIPQQAVTTVTNIDDIESYILKCEEKDNYQYIKAIDIPASERDAVMSELKFMGIAAGSIFPGIDGICEELKEQNFVR